MQQSCDQQNFLKNRENVSNAIPNGQQGSVMVMAVMILALLTIIAISSSNTSIMESQIVRNTAIRKQNFYQAESGVIEAAQALENLKNTVTLRSKSRPYLNSVNIPWLINDNSVDMTDRTVWDDDDVNNDDNAETCSIDGDTHFTVVQVNIAKKSSLGMENPDQLYEYAVYGLYNGTDGEAFIEAGFKKRF